MDTSHLESHESVLPAGHIMGRRWQDGGIHGIQKWAYHIPDFGLVEAKCQLSNSFLGFYLEAKRILSQIQRLIVNSYPRGLKIAPNSLVLDLQH